MPGLNRSIFIACIFYINNVHFCESETTCTVGQTSSDLLETNLTERILSFVADGKPQALFASIKNFHDTWKLCGVNTKLQIVKKGREFVEFIKKRFGIDASTLTDEQLYQGQPVELSGYLFFGFVFDTKLRTVTEITQGLGKVTNYNGPHSNEIGFAVTARKTIASKGQWTGTIPRGAFMYTRSILLPKCDNTETDVIEGSTTYPLYIDSDGFASFEYVVYSEKYGQGVMHGEEIHSQAAYVVSMTMKFSD
ncbi:unnamed protein product [Owenia fusiformis]|uniref:Uncharacterized protein n=1 Tax=Owenia fusiformis TaxID=6347 RepID=A0A8S4NKY8_OWEFU|nr:unnamed protein product [Owenia fusiformis]